MTFLTSLLEHQEKAVEKLSKLKVGALYMEQGTGKTRTALELVVNRFNAGKIKHVLWLCPCSVKTGLHRDIIKHIGYFPDYITICGIETLSSSVKWNLKLLNLVKKTNCYLIVDESNLVKNFRANRTENIIRLSEYCKYKLILNGTPISKNEADLFAQWYILDWRILGYKSYWSFSANHLVYDEHIKDKVIRCLNVDYLAEKIAPYTYQVKKSECLDLPEKTYDKVYYDLTYEQYNHYDEVANNLMFDLNELEPNTIYRLFTGLQNVISGFSVDTSGKTLKKSIFFSNPLNNPRIKCLLRILSGINEYEKVIIFCKYTQEINDIINVLTDEYGNESAVKFNGDLSQKTRQTNIDKFRIDSRFFVANKTCAGYGLNLQFCSYVIYYNNDWDYATRAQSEDRVHRIGQHKNVNIIDIIASYTLDERIYKCLVRKENLVDEFKSEIDKLKNKQELKDWLFVKENRKRTKCNISDLIERSTNA